MAAYESPELALKGAILRTIPDASDTEAVAATNGSHDLTAYGAGPVDLRGKWVFFKARGGNVTLRRIVAAETPTLVLGQDLTILDGEMEEFFVDKGTTHSSLRTIGSAVCQLDVLFDSEV